MEHYTRIIWKYQEYGTVNRDNLEISGTHGTIYLEVSGTYGTLYRDNLEISGTHGTVYRDNWKISGTHGTVYGGFLSKREILIILCDMFTRFGYPAFPGNLVVHILSQPERL